MHASIAHRIERHQIALVAMSAPRLLREFTPVRPPMAVAPLAQSLTIRELVALAHVRAQANRS